VLGRAGWRESTRQRKHSDGFARRGGVHINRVGANAATIALDLNEFHQRSRRNFFANLNHAVLLMVMDPQV
jgi:hypothetical protein